MQRDMELVRKILLKIEHDGSTKSIFNLPIDGYDMEEVAYHCKMLYEQNLISGYKGNYADNSLYSFSIGTLTWEGHDFIDSISDDGFWNKVKDILKAKKIPLTVEAVKMAIPIVIKALLD
jgi:hypothetical protein